jgi:hypothetical protein
MALNGRPTNMFHHRPPTPESLNTSETGTPPPSLMSDSSSDMSYELEHPKKTPDLKIALSTSPDPYKTTEKEFSPTSQAHDHMPLPAQSAAMAYVVSLLHALPFIFRVGPLPDGPHAEILQPLDPLETASIARELNTMNTYGKVLISGPLNPTILHQQRGTAYIALRALPISTQQIAMALTLISATYPYHYGWNHRVTYPISHSTLIPPIPASRSISLTKTYFYSKFDDGLIIHQDDRCQVYRDKSYFPNHADDFRNRPLDYPFGWTKGIDEFCIRHHHHPDCTDPLRRAFIEREFIAHTIQGTDNLELLDTYLQTIYSNVTGSTLQWFQSSPTPVQDNIQERADLADLYSQVDQQGGRIYHSKKGLRITIPEEKWTNWKTLTPNSQSRFTRVAWAQLTQFDKMALMTGIKEGKLDDKLLIYFDFDDDAKHDDFWSTELHTVRQYFIELITHTGAYHYYNHYVAQDLAYDNHPLELPLQHQWDSGERPHYIFLPYSKLMLRWDANVHRWEYETHSSNSLSPYSPNSCSSYNSDNHRLTPSSESMDETYEERDCLID